jgi:tubulin-specific chaperone D
MADYFSLGNRSESFTSIAFSVAQFEEYRLPILSHLFKSKLCHWDQAIRILASQSLGRLSLLDAGFVGGTVIPSLLVDSLDPRDVKRRHGAILGLAEIVLACKDLDQGHGVFESLLPSETRASLADLVPAIEKKRLFRGKGGEQIRAAVCRFIECMCTTCISLTVTQQVALLDSIDACLPHPSKTIQEQAAKALGALMRSYFPVSSKGPSDRLQKRVVDKYVNQLRTAINPAATRGFALALGALPAKLLAPSDKVLESVLACLCKSSRPDALVGNERDAETRRNSLIALARICKSIGIVQIHDGAHDSSDFPVVRLSKNQVSQVFTAFFSGLADYNMERRGDVGSWSRIVAMDGLEALSLQIVKEYKERRIDEFLDEQTCTRVVGCLLKQLSEKLDAVRSHAGECLGRILRQTDAQIPFIPQQARLQRALNVGSGGDSANWADASLTFPMVMQVVSIDEFFEYIVSGLIISVGCLTESVAKHASKALLKWVKGEKGTERVQLLGDSKFYLSTNAAHSIQAVVA